MDLNRFRKCLLKQNKIIETFEVEKEKQKGKNCKVGLLNLIWGENSD